MKYCSVDCQKIHRKQHKKACKERAAELKDDKLFSQGTERAEEDFCPLCQLAIPMPSGNDGRRQCIFYLCCLKMVCEGCGFAAKKRGMLGCPFCRTPIEGNDVKSVGMIQKRVAAKDPVAIVHLGFAHFQGMYGLEKSVSRATELWLEAAELGSIKALGKIGASHYYGSDGLARDTVKGIQCWEVAAMQGEIGSRHMLGVVELGNRKFDRAVRHFLISAKLGHKGSLDSIKMIFALGLASENQYAEALKGYQDAVEEMKSPDRDAVAALLDDSFAY